jgi:hypothetical protein
MGLVAQPANTAGVGMVANSIKSQLVILSSAIPPRTHYTNIPNTYHFIALFNLIRLSVAEVKYIIV